MPIITSFLLNQHHHLFKNKSRENIKNYRLQTNKTVKHENYITFEPPQTERRLYWLFIAPSDSLPMHRPSRSRVTENGENRCDPPCYMTNERIDDLLDEEEYYDGQGFHTYRRELVNFSRGSNVTEEFLARSTIQNLGTLFHEEFHHDRSRNRGHWNSYVEESLATAFGHVMASYFIEEHWQENQMLDHSMIEEAWGRVDSRRSYAQFINSYVAELNEIYDSDESAAQISQQRDACLSRARSERSSVNNALLWHENAYTAMYPVAVDIARHCSREEFIEIMRNAPRYQDVAQLYLEANLARLTRTSDQSSP